MVIIVSLTGIASFTIPRFNLAISIRMLRFPLMFLASIFGIFGIMLGTIILVLHLCKLQSFGIPYLSGISPFKRDEVKDIFVRAPWWTMTRRPGTYSRGNGQKERKERTQKMKKTIYKCVLPLLICILLTGCWDRTEINDIAFVVSSAIDKKKDQYQWPCRFPWSAN